MTERKQYLDTVKGIGIILVILGHTYGIPDYIYSLIYSFHMPLFFIISGMVYNEKSNSELSLKKFIKNKAKSYLIPYFFYAGLNLILELLMSYFLYHETITVYSIVEYIKGILYCYADIQHMPNCSPLWFLICLFISSIIFRCVIKYLSKYFIIVAAVFCIISYLLSIFVEIRLPWNLSTSFMAVAFMLLGFILKTFEKKIIILICLFIPGIGAALFNGANVGMNENTYGNLLLFLLAAISISYFVIYLCKRFDMCKPGFLSWLGRNTLPVIGLNYFLRDFTTEIYYFIPVVNQYKIHWTISFVMTLVSCVCLILIKNYIKTKIHNLRLKT